MEESMSEEQEPQGQDQEAEEDQPDLGDRQLDKKFTRPGVEKRG